MACYRTLLAHCGPGPLGAETSQPLRPPPSTLRPPPSFAAARRSGQVDAPCASALSQLDLKSERSDGAEDGEV